MRREAAHANGAAIARKLGYAARRSLVAFSGHLWTLYPWMRGYVAPLRRRGSQPWVHFVEDRKVGRVVISGEARVVPGAERAVVVVHGLGGDATSHACRSACAQIERHGWSALNLCLRGADLRGNDYYHGALTDDVHAALVEFGAGHAKLHVLGFSIGGHVALHVARESQDPRLASVAAISSPLDLAAARAHIDRKRAFYRHHILRACKRVYASVATRAEVPTPVAEVERARTLWDLDRLTIVPRFGFADPAEYYALSSIAPHLPQLPRKALWVGATHDPLVPARVVRAALAQANQNLETRLIPRGGHIAFPHDLDLGFEGPRGLVTQVLSWFMQT
jgi:uncharacterized protein